MSWAPSEDAKCRETTDLHPIELVIQGKPKNIGAFDVRRCLPVRERRAIGPFVFFDEMGPADLTPDQNMDVRPHPHVNLATITYLFEGAVMHRDSLGTSLPIEPGAVNLMVAGRGIVHSERTPEAMRDRPKRMHGLQLWIGLPEADEETDPLFEHHPADTIPEWREDGYVARLVMGEVGERRSPVKTFSPILYVVYALEAGARLTLPDAEERGLYVVDGQIEIDGETVEAGTMVVLRPNAEVRVATTAPTRCALIGGASLGPRHIFWNFVSSRPERIEQAKDDWREHRFPVVPGDDQERIPLPE